MSQHEAARPLNELQRMIAEDQALACPKCLGHAWLGGRRISEPGVHHGENTRSVDTGRQCDACEGSGVRRLTEGKAP